MKINYNSKRQVLINCDPHTWIKEGVYKHWQIQVRKESNEYKLIVRGSLHKFYHGNNSGSFSVSEVMAALQGMCDLFAIDQKDAKVTKLEVGINLSVTFPVYSYLNSNLLYHKKRDKREMDKKGVGYTFDYDDYKLKLYQKEIFVLRFEVKYTSIDKLKRFGIEAVGDLNIGNIHRLALTLLPEWNEIIMRDGINVYHKNRHLPDLTEGEREKLLEFTSIAFHQSYNELLAAAKNDNRKKDSLRQKANRLKVSCMNIIRRKGNGVHQELAFIIKKGVEELISN
ncbi:hypothetical protein MD537_09720 [Flavihumibacter sediminis]|nr:hypothetical protein [Flavihumibacter sediminis]